MSDKPLTDREADLYALATLFPAAGSPTWQEMVAASVTPLDALRRLNERERVSVWGWARQ